MSVTATIDDPVVIKRILTHLGLPLDGGEPDAGRSPPDQEEVATS